MPDHIADYLTECEHEGQSRTHVGNKRSQLHLLVKSTEATRLGDLEPNVVSGHLQQLKRMGKSHRTVNQHRSTVNSFLNWCVQKKRLAANPLKGRAVKRLDEEDDRRRVRRAMSEAELTMLLASTPTRRTVYFVAYWTGLRRGEIKAVAWMDVDLDGGRARVRRSVGKANREDWIPLRGEVVDALAAIRPTDASPTDRVFRTIPRIKTFHRDCAQAREAWIDAAKDPAERQRCEASNFLTRFDAEGRQLDLHCLRTSLGTHLAQNKVTPQVAQRVLRHADMRVTLKHYTDLRLSDERAAIESLPAIGADMDDDGAVAPAATGTVGQPAPEARSACAADLRLNMASDDMARQGGTDQVSPAGDPCTRAQVPYNAADDTHSHTVSTQGKTNEENPRKSLKHGPLAQLASALP